MTVTREEFEMLRAQVAENGRHLDQVDTVGTRGIGPLSVQVAEIIKDVNDVRGELREFRRDHERLHENEERSRTAGRRWLIGSIIAAMAAVEAPILWIITHLHA